MSVRCFLAIALCAAALACAPSVKPLGGTPTVASIPPTTLPATPQQLQFTWKYSDDSFQANGEGVVRVGPPNRARLDFFLQNGVAGGMAILDRDSLIIPGIELVRRFLPPVPLLWSSLGKLVVPPTRDTVARADGDTLRVDMGAIRGQNAAQADGAVWRATFAGVRLVKLERIQGGRVLEWMTRTIAANGTGELQYVNEGGRRRLTISVTSTRNVEAFDEGIWKRP